MEKNSDCDVVIEHYKALRERFVVQGNRLWTRFHYFLTVEAALLGIYLTKAATISVSWPKFGILYLGLFWTILWFIIGAQDLWFYEQARKRLDEFKSKYIVAGLVGWDEKAEYYTVPWWKKPFCFKIAKCGVTSFASVIPFLFIFIWLFVWIFG